MRKRPTVFSGSVLAALRAGPFRSPAHVMLEEVRNGTGYERRQRYADGLVVSCFPSRGIWFAGVEVKVDRRDWRREIDDPTKAAEIQRWCDYWWVAAPPGTVELAEVPETWGLIVVDGKKCTIAKKAPKLAPEPLTASFVASVIRNTVQSQDAIRVCARAEGYRAAKEEFGADALEKLRGENYEAQRAKASAEARLGYVERDLATLRTSVERFEDAAGLPRCTVTAGGPYGGSNHGELYAVAKALAAVPDVAAHLRAAAEAIEALGVKGAA